MAKKIRLEPELEECACLWTPAKRRAVAKKLERWVHQLEFSALILEAEAAPKPPPRLIPLPHRKLVLN